MIDQYPPANGVLTSLIWRKTAAGGETSLSGYDNANQALSYTPGQEQVYLNGILLVRGDDYTATNGTSITGLTALAASDFIQVNCYNNFSVASVPTTSLTGEVTNSQITSLATSKLTGTIANNQLANSSITINGSAVSLGGSTTIAGGSAQDDAPTSPTEGQLWLDTNGTLATTGFTEKATLTTTGDIYYASAANTPARLGIGSTDQVLKVSGGLPTWGSAPATFKSYTLANPGGTALTGASTVTVSGLDADSIYIFVDSVSSSVQSNTYFLIRLNTDSGSNYRSYGGILANLTSYGGTVLQRINQQFGNPATAIYSGVMGDDVSGVLEISAHIQGCKSTNPKMYSVTSGAQTGDNKKGVFLNGFYTGSAPITSISIVTTQGNLDAGTVYVYTSN